MLEDFEGEDALAQWQFSNGPEFPGATGRVGESVGHAGKGARLTYDLTQGGNYVSLSWTFREPVRSELLALWLRQPPRSQAKLRIYDASGQAFEYSIARPLEAMDPSSWFRVVIDVNEFTGSFGGRNDGMLQQPLTGISVLAIPEFEIVGSPTGFVEFDELAALDEQRATLRLDAPSLIPAPEDAAELAPRLAINVHSTNDERGLDEASAAGFSTIRVDLGWSDIEAVRGRYDFSGFDALLSSLSRRGMRMHLILNYLNPLYPGFADPDFMAVTLPAFSAMARAAAEHFRERDVSYEIWNEPNSSRFWSRSTDDFAQLSTAASSAIRLGDPNAEICSGGVSGFDYRFISEYLNAGGGADADAIGVHPYRKGGGETAGHDLLLMRAIISESRGTTLPVWDTEWGYSSTWYGDGHSRDARNRHAQLVTRELLSAWSLGFPLVVYYDLRDGGVDPGDAEQNFGLLQDDYADKPAMVAVRKLTQLSRDRRYVGLVRTGLNSLHALRLEGAEDRWVILWWDNPKRSVTVELPMHAVCTDLLGNEIQTDSPATLKLAESTGPVYLRFPSSEPVTGAGGSSSTRSSGGTTAGGRTTALRSLEASGGTANLPKPPGGATTGRAGASAGAAGGLGVAGDGSQSETEVAGCRCSTPSHDRSTSWGVVWLIAAATLRRRRERRHHSGSPC